MLEKEYQEKSDSYYAQERIEMLDFITDKPKSVLDVGCSSGSFGNLLKQTFGCEVWGIEPDAKSATKAKLVLDNVFNSIFDDSIDFEGKKFDCIIFNDVLEHMVNPGEALIRCKGLLAVGGMIISSIPNIRYFDAIHHILVKKDFKYVDGGIFDKTHLRFFTKTSAERLFVDAGYTIYKSKGINSIKEINPKGYKRFKLLNSIFFKKLADMEYLQFAIIARLKKD